VLRPRRQGSRQGGRNALGRTAQGEVTVTDG
jgi:hypothetical protein